MSIKFGKNLKTLRKQTVTTIALILILAISAIMTALPAAIAHTPSWTIPTYAFISIQPNPVGLSQEVFVNFWIDKVPATAATIYGDRWQNFTVTVTKPDGSKTSLGPFTSDDVGGSHTTYVPTQLGSYSFVFNFPGQTIVGANPNPISGTTNKQSVGDYYSPSTSRTVIITVQQAQIQSYPSTPLPDGYWQRPIFGENTNWYTISGNWLGAGSYNATANFDPYTTAPNTSHIVWTKPYAGTLNGGGLIGGEFGGSEVNSNYYSTAQYETKFSPIIMNGILYYLQIPGTSVSPQGWVAVDIRTGQTIWTHTPVPSTSGISGQSAINVTTLLRGQIEDYVSPNQFGGLAYLWTNEPTVTPNTGSTYGMYDATSGNWILNIVNGTGVSFVEGDDGSMLGYYINSTDRTLNLWNSSQAIIKFSNSFGGGGGNIEWSWRPVQGASIPWSLGLMWSVPMVTKMTASNGTTVDINAAYAESAGVSSPLAISKIADVILVNTVPGAGIAFNQPGYIISEGYSLTTGQLLWGPLNQTQAPFCRLSLSAIGSGVFVVFTYETQTFTGYSTTTGQKLWGPVSIAQAEVPWGYYVTGAMIAYGNLYTADFGGYVNCFDAKTGTLKWTYWTGPSGYETPYGVWPIVNIQAIADGKIFLMGGHLYSPPLFKGGQLYCINATSGNLLWSSPSFAITNGAACALADGYLIMPNAYDLRLYAYNKGQSATTVSAPDVAISQGTSLVIKGTVTDQSPGQTCLGIPAAGTPAISDASMGAWMEYLYMQQPKPTNATGVLVTLSVFDPNNNTYVIGTTTSDTDGNFGLVWTPPVTGFYKVTATFAGSNSYYSSHAENMFAVTKAVSAAPAATVAPTQTVAPTSAPTQTPTSPSPSIAAQPNSGTPVATYIAIAAAVVIIAVVAAAVVLRRRK